MFFITLFWVFWKKKRNEKINGKRTTGEHDSTKISLFRQIHHWRMRKRRRMENDLVPFINLCEREQKNVSLCSLFSHSLFVGIVSGRNHVQWWSLPVLSIALRKCFCHTLQRRVEKRNESNSLSLLFCNSFKLFNWFHLFLFDKSCGVFLDI